MKYFTKNIEDQIAAYIARTWIKDSEQSLQRGNKPAKLSAVLDNSVLLEGFVEEFVSIYKCDFAISFDTMLSAAGKKRVRQLAIEKATYALKNFDKHADLLQHFVDRAKTAPQKGSEFFVAQLSHAGEGKWYRDGFKVRRTAEGFYMCNSHAQPLTVKTIASAQDIAATMRGYGALCIVELRLDGTTQLHQVIDNVDVANIISREEAAKMCA